LKDQDGLEVCKTIEIDNFEKLILESFNQHKDTPEKTKKGTKKGNDKKDKKK